MCVCVSVVYVLCVYVRGVCVCETVGVVCVKQSCVSVCETVGVVSVTMSSYLSL